MQKCTHDKNIMNKRCEKQNQLYEVSVNKLQYNSCVGIGTDVNVLNKVGRLEETLKHSAIVKVASEISSEIYLANMVLG